VTINWNDEHEANEASFEEYWTAVDEELLALTGHDTMYFPVSADDIAAYQENGDTPTQAAKDIADLNEADYA